MSPLSPALHLDMPLSPLHFSEVFPLFFLDRVSDEVNCRGRGMRAALAPRPETRDNEQRVLLAYCLPTSVARASRMLRNKHHLCGHTLFYELSHHTGWILKCC